MNITDKDIWLLKEGAHFALYQKLGAHLIPSQGCRFAVWAPNAAYVAVMGDFNNWNPETHPLFLRKDGSGIWEGAVHNASHGQKYKYYLISQEGFRIEKGDPYAYFWEQPPGNASIIWDLSHEWRDHSWVFSRDKLNNLQSPISIYEIHLPSWRRVPEERNRPLTYQELAKFLPAYIKEMGFTHVEFLPIMEHPLYSSWGYQTGGYYAPTSRYGTPQQFMQLIESLHEFGIGVILDWVPSHFPADPHGLANFDGTTLYEYSNPKKRTQPEWNTLIFNYESPHVKNFLISNALFWLDKYHADGLRFDAVASMIYLSYAKKNGEWEPNKYGGEENLEALHFLRSLNTEVYAKYPYIQTIAEESTAWSMVSRPTYMGGLGFGMKWNMGWMHDVLHYMSLDPIHRKYHHNTLLFSIHYAFAENFILPLSHDEVVYGKRSLLSKMPGDDWQKFANLRLLFGYMYGHPGKKLLFMGGEFGQWNEWYHDASLDWHLLQFSSHQQIQKWIKDLNGFYRSHPALYELDFNPEGFEWIDTHDWEQSIICFLRKSAHAKEMILVVCNFTPVARYNYRIGVPQAGYWKEMLNSDSKIYGGSGQGNAGGLLTEKIESQGRPNSLCATLPPLSTLYFKFS